MEHRAMLNDGPVFPRSALGSIVRPGLALAMPCQNGLLLAPLAQAAASARVFGWLGAARSGLGGEAEGFGALLGVVVEGGVERGELFLRVEREDGSTQ